MDFSLRCNNLKCRAQLTEQAVVTTCSHIFCSACSHNLGLDAAPTAHRTCPACETSLPNPDDAVSTQLNPTEDYKTSVLSGLSPSLQLDQEKLQAENTNLVQAFREKSRKHQQTQELYDRLKRKEMTAATQSAAFESVDDVLGNVSSRAGHVRAPQQSLLSKQQGQHETSQYPYDPSQGFGHQRDGSNGSGGSGGMMPPPPLRRPGAFGNHLFGNSNLTPSQHRTQLGSRVQTHLPQHAGQHAPNTAPGPPYVPTSSQRLPLGGPGSVNRNSFGGYGMSAGLKVGRQHGRAV
ncbi:MAG: hypothetical protein L6R38_004229 [Xanthoria sp. 2 TBL-2021]|nr:MAG: hypothetical protein L6R38_004229 [Xanthoria sp. 2 TBL-2021]